MKNTIKNIFITLLLACFSLTANAGYGIKRGQWDYGPEITLSSPLYGILLGELGALYGEDRPHWAPIVMTKTYAGSPSVIISHGTYDGELKKVTGRMAFGAKEKKTKWYELNLENFSVGYGVTYMSKDVPLGFSAKIAYEQLGFDATMSRDGVVIERGKLNKQMIVPELLLKIRIGNYRKGDGLICIDIGSCYDYAIGAKCLSYKSKNVVKSGFAGVIGFSIADPTLHFQVGGDFYFPTYHYINKDYSPDHGNSYPFKNVFQSDKVEAMCFYLRLGF